MRSKGLLIVASSHELPLPTQFFHCVATSPPYFGLREYRGDQMVNWPEVIYTPMASYMDFKMYVPAFTCPLGGEPTIEMYTAHMVLVAREVRRVLRDDGVFWLNLGDSFNGSGGAGGDYREGGIREGQPTYKGRNLDYLNAGDLIMMPSRLALALQADGWIVRQLNIWQKTNPPPEDNNGWRYENNILKRESWRHTSSHEFVLQLTKKMGYWGDLERVRLEPTETSPAGPNPRSVFTYSTSSYKGAHYAVYPGHLIAPLIHATCPKRVCSVCGQGWSPEVQRIKHPTRDMEAQREKAAERTGRTDGHVPGPEGQLDNVILLGYRPTCSCGIVEAAESSTKEQAAGWVLDPFMGSGTTGVVAKEFGVNYVGIDISFQYLDEQAKVRTKIGQPSKQLDDLPMFENNFKSKDIDK